MTVSSTTTKASLSANGTAHSFAYGFKIFADTDLLVIIRSATGTETTKTLNTHYVVTGAGSDSGGNVLFKFNTGNASDAHFSNTDQRPANGETVVIKRVLTLTQGTDYVANDPFPAESHETALDRLTFITQQQQEQLDRTFKVSQTNTIATAEFTADATSRANKVLGFDGSGNLIASQELGVFKGTDTTVTTSAYDARDLVKSTTTAQLNNVYIALQASPVGTSLTDTTYWALIVDAVTAAQAATSAASSATTAQGHANTATTKATEASDSATKSENYAVKVDGAVPSTSDYSSKAGAVGGTGVTDAAGAGAAKQWAVDQTADGVDGTEFSAKEYAIGVQQSVGSAKQWAIGGGGSFDTNTPVAGGVFSAKYYAELAAASADSFDDVYLGPKSSDPTQDNDGDALNAGDLYYNTNSTTLRVFTGSAWEDAVVSTSGFATAGFSIAMSIAL